MDKSTYDYNERPKNFQRKDFWSQVRRTINGKPVDQKQIQLIVDQIILILNLQSCDTLLDVGCGNGALTDLVASRVEKVLGVDPSNYLIEVANENFSSENAIFEQMNAGELMRSMSSINFNKCLLYGVSSFLNDSEIDSLIDWFFAKKNTSMMLGNVRDRNLASEFYNETPKLSELNDYKSSMGKWRTREYFIELCSKKGLEIKFYKMPSEFYASKYYFDLLITRP